MHFLVRHRWETLIISWQTPSMPGRTLACHSVSWTAGEALVSSGLVMWQYGGTELQHGHSEGFKAVRVTCSFTVCFVYERARAPRHFLLGNQGTQWGNCEFLLEPFKSTKAIARDMEASAHNASVKCQAWLCPNLEWTLKRHNYPPPHPLKFLNKIF